MFSSGKFSMFICGYKVFFFIIGSNSVKEGNCI